MALHLLAACPGCGRQFDVADVGRSRGGSPLAPGDRFACSCGALVTVPSGRSEDAAVVACSACGAPRGDGATACTYCGAEFTLHELALDAICPRCAARVSRRGRFCHHCALPLTAPRTPGTPSDHFCPACSNHGRDRRLVSRRVGEGADDVHLFACQGCGGLWLDTEVFRVLIERARRGRLGLAAPRSDRTAPPEALAAGSAATDWSYRPCPVCGKLMNRRNYGQRSGVILDLCADHGLWFDADELRRVLDWVRGGGATPEELPAAEQPTPALPPWSAEPWGRGWDVEPGLLSMVVDFVTAAAGALWSRHR